jgi:hypothetical protein
MIEDLLKIPDFLRRKKRRGRPRKIEDTPVEVNPHIEWDKIKQERYGTKYNIMLWHHFPRIGSGNRIIYVSEKRKWVYIVSHTGDPYTTQPTRTKILKSKWNDIKKSHERYLKRNGVKVI